MTANQKTGLLIAGFYVVTIAAFSALLIDSFLLQRSIAFRLDDPNPALRIAAIRATGEEGYVDLLTKALQDEDPDVRLVAVMHLRRRGEKAAPSSRALLMASIQDDHAGVRREAAEALHAVGATAAPTLIEALGDPNPRVRGTAAQALRVVAFISNGGRAPSADALSSSAAALEEASRDKDEEVRENAANSLAYIRRAAAGERLYEGK